MAEKPQIVIVDDEARARAALRDYVETQSSYGGVCTVCGPEERQDAEGVSYIYIGEDCPLAFEPSVQFSKPVRIGAVGDAIEKQLKLQSQSAQIKVLSVGLWELDMVHNLLSREDKPGAGPRLTDKEKEILLFLHENADQSVSREDLLKAVWGYAEGIETHTLETHIYRLRQKIEEDPAKPENLLTTETGYILAGS